jgi:aminopeptidase N
VKPRTLALAGILAAATISCTSPDVHTEAAREQGDATARPPATASTEPPPPAEPAPAPEPPPTTTTNTPPPTTTLRPGSASDSAGDSLYDELGSADLDVQSYDVRLSYDPDTRAIDASVTIASAVARPVDELVLDADELTVEAVTVDGEPATFAHDGGELVIDPGGRVGPRGPDDPISIAVTYADEAGAVESGGLSAEGWFPTDDGSFVLNEPDGAHTWLPTNDHPSDKATWRFELTVPDGVAAIANGHLVDRRDGARGDTWVWEQREPMATYLIQLLTGDYEVLDGGTAGDTPLVNVVVAGDEEQMQRYFDLTDDQVAFFEPLFGPYPLDQYGLAFTESFPGLAMETQGRSLFSRRDFPDSDPGLIQHLLLAHELAHQWFGNAVTPADWGDLWLNESFASYGQWLWLDHVGLWNLQAQAEQNLRRRQEATEPTAEPTAGNLFGYERYDGGAVVVHALRGELGDDVFFELLQRWVSENDGASRTTEDFTALADEVAGRSLDDFFASWLYADALPAEYP